MHILPQTRKTDGTNVLIKLAHGMASFLWLQSLLQQLLVVQKPPCFARFCGFSRNVALRLWRRSLAFHFWMFPCVQACLKIEHRTLINAPVHLESGTQQQHGVAVSCRLRFSPTLLFWGVYTWGWYVHLYWSRTCFLQCRSAFPYLYLSAAGDGATGEKHSCRSSNSLILVKLYVWSTRCAYFDLLTAPCVCNSNLPWMVWFSEQQGSLVGFEQLTAPDLRHKKRDVLPSLLVLVSNMRRLWNIHTHLFILGWWDQIVSADEQNM